MLIFNPIIPLRTAWRVLLVPYEKMPICILFQGTRPPECILAIVCLFMLTRAISVFCEQHISLPRWDC